MPDPTPEPISEEAIGASAVAKASWYILPLIGLGYGIAFIDRQNLSYAKAALSRDLHFDPGVYGLGAGLFFLSYAACEIPSNLMLYKYGARKWLSRILITWGLIAMGMMFIHTTTEFYVGRLLLGIGEAGFFPGIIYYVSQWFPPELRARAIGRFYIAYPLSTVVMGLASPPLLKLDGVFGLHGWQWLFLIEGLPAVLLSAVFMRFLPDGPKDAKFLTEPERAWLLDRVSKDAQTGTHRHSVFAALRDPRVLLIGLFSFCMQFSMYGFQLFQPSLMANYTHLSDSWVGWINAGMGLLGAVAMLLNAAHSDKKNERYIHTIVPSLLILAGFLTGGLNLPAWIVVPGFACVVIGNSALQPAYLALAPTFLKERSAAAGIAAINMIGILGAGFGPYLVGLANKYTHSDQRGILTMAAPTLVSILIMLYMRHMVRKQESTMSATPVPNQ